MRLVHCSYHKCLTSLFQLVFRNYFASIGRAEDYIHFKSEIGSFTRYGTHYALSSINNHCLGHDEFPDVRISRFIRDPRDLVVSGYFYHKSASEPWTRIQQPTKSDWLSVNGSLPSGLDEHESFADMLNKLPVDEGLIAEIDFRRFHFESMRKWAEADERVLLLKYEDYVGDEITLFRKLLDYYQFPEDQYSAVLVFVEKYSVKKQAGQTKHIRDPKPSQWAEFFSPRVASYFNERYADILERYDY